MSRFLSLLGLCVLAVENVFCLNCYVTDRTSMTSGNFAHNLEDCGSSINNMIPNIPESDMKWMCHKMTISDAFRGCMFPGDCERVKELFKEMPFLDGITALDCYGCTGDGCNSASKRSVFGSVAVVLVSVYVF